MSEFETIFQNKAGWVSLTLESGSDLLELTIEDLRNLSDAINDAIFWLRSRNGDIQQEIFERKSQLEANENDRPS